MDTLITSFRRVEPFLAALVTLGVVAFWVLRARYVAAGSRRAWTALWTLLLFLPSLALLVGWAVLWFQHTRGPAHWIIWLALIPAAILVRFLPPMVVGLWRERYLGQHLSTSVIGATMISTHVVVHGADALHWATRELRVVMLIFPLGAVARLVSWLVAR